MSLLEHPSALALLADAEVSAEDVRGCCRRLDHFLRRYLPRFYRKEHHELARVVLQGAMDPRVPESESRQVYEKVKANGGVTDYVLFPDEGHGFAKLPNRIKAYESIVAFLDKHVRKQQ